MTAISMSFAADIFEDRLHVSTCGTPAPQRAAWSSDQLKVGVPIQLQQAAHKFIEANSPSIKISTSEVTQSASYSGLLTHAGVSALERHFLDYRHTYKVFLVNSFGGDSAAAIKLAGIVRDARMKLIIDGFCASACANHLLGPMLVDRLVEVRGLVLLHGSAAKCLAFRSNLDHISLIGIRKWLDLRDSAQREERARRPMLFEAALSLSQRPDRGALDGQPRSYLQLGFDLLAEMGATVARSSGGSLDEYLRWLIDQKRFGVLPYVTFHNGSEILRASAIASNSPGR